MKFAFKNALAAIPLALSFAAPVTGATIDQAWKENGVYLYGLKVKGDIVRGDAEKLLTKLLDFYNILGPVVDTIYLMSKGGDVEEAMNMGALIRRLRLGTEVPIWDTNKPPISFVLPDNKDNFICASALLPGLCWRS